MSRLLTILCICLVCNLPFHAHFPAQKVELEEEKNRKKIRSLSWAQHRTSILKPSWSISQSPGLAFGPVRSMFGCQPNRLQPCARRFETNGGVWISHDAAHTWQPVNDTAHSLCVTSIAQNYYRSNEFYYCSGVNIFVNGDLQYDIFRSVDNGQTFNP